MSRFDEIAQIYDHRLPLLRSPEIWEQTLRMTSSFWRLNFCEAMLLTLQNPKAEMCGTIDQWNNIGRYILQQYSEAARIHSSCTFSMCARPTERRTIPSGSSPSEWLTV